jgi:cell division protein FtsB
MRDIGQRINRYRLSRYAPPEDRVRRRLRWFWLLGLIAVLWIGLVGDHSLWRIWNLSRENAKAQRQLAAARAELNRLDAQVRSPEASRELAEKELREKNGMARPGEIVYRIRGGSADSLAK